ncbi:hypothetical protein PUN28_007621 [Cardiocondyla obscurior]|uniref:ATP synthase F0 subunit 8 n=1 Tax=Cardiocondyla obscurior TaxID=286306 RepID=A0AAW2G620_9HYME
MLMEGLLFFYFLFFLYFFLLFFFYSIIDTASKKEKNREREGNFRKYGDPAVKLAPRPAPVALLFNYKNVNFFLKTESLDKSMYIPIRKK